MLTPRDIHEADFKRVWKGYSPEEVDEFLGRVVLEYEKIYKENLALREKVEALEERVAKYTSSETQIAVTLEVAKEAAADAKAAAAKEAEATLLRARAEADQIIERARRVAAAKAQQLLGLQESVERFRSQASGALKSFLAEMDNWEIDVPDVIAQEVAAGDDPGEQFDLEDDEELEDIDDRPDRP